MPTSSHLNIEQISQPANEILEVTEHLIEDIGNGKKDDNKKDQSPAESFVKCKRTLTVAVVLLWLLVISSIIVWEIRLFVAENVNELLPINIVCPANSTKVWKPVTPIHPLNKKIYCKVTNRTPKTNVNGSRLVPGLTPIELIVRSMNQTFDPCFDFHQYVCDGINNRRVMDIYHRTLVLEENLLMSKKARDLPYKSIQRYFDEISKCSSKECKHEAYENFRLPILMATIELANVRSSIFAVFNETRNVVKDLVSKSQMKKSKVDLKKLFDQTTLHLGLPDDFADWKVLDEIFSECSPCTNDSIIEIFKLKYGRKPNW